MILCSKAAAQELRTKGKRRKVMSGEVKPAKEDLAEQESKKASYCRREHHSPITISPGILQLTIVYKALPKCDISTYETCITHTFDNRRCSTCWPATLRTSSDSRQPGVSHRSQEFQPACHGERRAHTPHLNWSAFISRHHITKQKTNLDTARPCHSQHPSSTARASP